MSVRIRTDTRTWHHQRVIWLALLVAVVLVVLTVAAVLGRVDGSLADATTTMSHVPLPDDGLTTADLDGLRFDTAFRGYRMSEVDGVIDRLRREIDDLESRLHGAPGDSETAVAETTAAESDAGETDASQPAAHRDADESVDHPAAVRD